MTKEYKKALDDIRLALTDIYEKYAVDGALTYAEMTKFNRLQNLEKQIVEILGPANRRSQALIEKLSKVNYDESFFRTAWSVDQATGVNIKWGLLNPETVKAAVDNPLRKISEKRLKEGSLTRISSAVTQGLIQGTSYPKMSVIVKDAINGTIKDAVRIVRTEGQRAAVLGQQAGLTTAADKGVEVKQVWDATLDGDTRPEHGALDGKERQEEGWYVPSIGWVTGPLQSGVPSFDINCRCAVSGRIEGLEPSLRRIRGEGVVPYTTYDKWKANMAKNGGKYKPERKINLKEGVFVPAKTLKEAQEWAINNNLGNNFNYSGFTIDQANSVNSAIYSIKTKMKQDFYLKDGVRKFSDDEIASFKKSGNVPIARYGANEILIDVDRFNIDNITENSIRFKSIDDAKERIKYYKTKISNGDYWDETEKTVLAERLSFWEKNLEKYSSMGRYMVAETPGEVIIHELGHYFEEMLISAENIEFLSPSRAIELGIEWKNTLTAEIEKIVLSEGIKLSEYAATNAAEYFAESFLSVIKGEEGVVNSNIYKFIKGFLE